MLGGEGQHMQMVRSQQLQVIARQDPCGHLDLLFH